MNPDMFSKFSIESEDKIIFSLYDEYCGYFSKYVFKRNILTEFSYGYSSP